MKKAYKTYKTYFGFPTKMLSIRPGTRRSSGGYSVVNRRVNYGSFQAKSRSETQNASRSCRVLSVNFFRYKRVLIKMIDIVLSYVPAYISYVSSKNKFWVSKNIDLLTQISVTSHHMSFQRTFCVKLSEQACMSAHGRFWSEIKRSV